MGKILLRGGAGARNPRRAGSQPKQTKVSNSPQPAGASDGGVDPLDAHSTMSQQALDSAKV